MTSREGHLTPAELADWLRLAHSHGLGASSRIQLLQHFKTPSALFRTSRAELRKLKVTPKVRQALLKQPPDLAARTERVQDWLAQPGNHVVTLTDPRYPARLTTLACAPVLLYVQGDPTILDSPAVALVGSRKPTAAGETLTRDMAVQLGRSGLTVVSGLAYGIDAAAHTSCVDHAGTTIAVVGTGLDQVYPRRHHALAARIAEHGALVSEFALGTPPLGRHFPQRNRIISGLSLAVVVVEATLRSGTLSTARHGLEQGREVMAVPGPIRSPLSRGCHQLLRQGATLVESAADILAEIAPQIDTDTLLAAGSSTRALAEGVPEKLTPAGRTKPASLDSTCQCLMDLIGYEPVSVDLLISHSGLPAGLVTSSLLQLELQGVVSIDNGGRYVRC